MRIALDKLMEKLGVGHTLSAYETFPWFYYDEGRGISCSAEVRMGPGGDDVEAEIQFLYDEGYVDPNPPPPPPPPPRPSYDDLYDGVSSTKKTEDEDVKGPQPIIPGVPVQIMRMKALPVVPNEWSPTELKVRGEDYVNRIYNWEEKGCEFFRACIQSLQMGELPNIEDLVAKELGDDDGTGGGKRGRIGRKAPKIKPAQLLGLKKGM